MHPTPVWATPRFVVLAIISYLAVHFAVRMAMWPTLGIDDAEQALFAQEFQWSYRNSAPPLFTWLLIGLTRMMGVGIVPISVIRYVLLGITYVFTFLTARRLIADPRLAALSTYSFVAICVFAFYSHHDLTHTTTMTAMIAVAWYVFVRLAETPRLAWYLVLGAVCGLGLLGKWNFVMFAAALPLTCLLLPAYRHLVLTGKPLVAILACAVIALPTIIAVLLGGPADRETLHGVLVGEDGSYLAHVLEGTLNLVTSTAAYPLPLLPLAALFFARPLWRGIRAGSEGPHTARGVSLGFVLASIAISLGLHLAPVIGLGAREFHERLMQPPLFILPMALFMLIERGRPSPGALSYYALALLLVVVATLGARIGLYAAGADYCGSCRNMVPFQELAAELRRAGYRGGGTILVDGFHVGGNMRVAFPQARIIDVDFPPSTWPARREASQCLLLWQVRTERAEPNAARPRLESYLANELDGHASAPHQDGTLAARMFASATREYHLGYSLYDQPVGDCG